MTAPVRSTSTEAATSTLEAASVVAGRPRATQALALSESEWRGRRDAHEQRVDGWTTDVLRRHSHAICDPVEDFLFDYYPYSPAQLRRWSPGHGRVLRGATFEDFPERPGFHPGRDGIAVDVSTVPAVGRRLSWVREVLRRTADRPAAFHCFGMHEWAMVHGAEQGEVRHSSLPLRVTPDDVRRTVDEVGLRCTHFDAYRFFTPAATPRNRFPLDRFSTIDFEQPGCIHANMDIYKWAFQLMPFVDSVLLADAFELAVQAREIDMRASPYDLALLGFTPIAIETTAGREEYVTHQQQLYAKAQPIRQQLLNVYQKMLERVSGLVGVTALAGQRFPSENVQTG